MIGLVDKVVWWHYWGNSPKPNHWRIVNQQIADVIVASELDKHAKIKVFFHGPKKHVEIARHQCKNIKNLEFKDNSNLSDFFEWPTLIEMWNEAQKIAENKKFLYLHSKGSTRIQAAVQDWRQYMLHFNVDRWKEMDSALESHDTCGVDLILNRHNKTFKRKENLYAGNFWWANSFHIKKLPKPVMSNDKRKRYDAEIWLFQSGQKSSHYCPWRTKMDLYKKRYPKSKYQNSKSTSSSTFTSNP